MRYSLKIPKLFGFFTLLVFLITSMALFAQSSSSKYYRDNVIRVKFEEPSISKVSLSKQNGIASSGITSVDQLNATFNAVSMKRVFSEGGKFKARREAFGLHLWYEIRFESGTDALNIVQAYQGDANIKIAEPVLAKTMDSDTKNHALEWVPNDPDYSEQYGYNNTGQTGGTPGADVSAEAAWNLETGDSNVVISVHDSGFDTDHPDLVNALWTNPNPTMGDIHGYNFADDNDNIYDSDGHGSHVSGTIAAMNNNGIGVSGLAGGGNGLGTGVSIMVCKVFGDNNVDGFAESYAYAADNGAVISQNSWGYTSAGFFEQAVLDGIDYFVANAGYDELGNPVGPILGGIVLFAAGNSGTDDEWYPGYYDATYAVAGTNHFDRVIENGVDGSWFGSNYGAWVELSAPGMFILSTVIDGYDEYSGTSMACPHVSAAAGLVASKYPGLTNAEVMLRIMGTTDPIDDLNPGFEGMLGTGRLNAYAALVEDDGLPPEAITDLSVLGTGQITAELQWTVPDVSTTGGPGLSEAPALYDIRYSETNITNDTDFENATQVSNPPNPLAPGETQTFTVSGLTPLTDYYFAIKSQDLFANKSAMSNVVMGTTEGAPILGTDPDELTADVETGTQSNQTLTLQNTGEGPLDWSLPGYAVLDVLNNPTIQKNKISKFDNIQLAKGQKDPRVGNPVIMGAGGPDNFGYTWMDSNEPGGPIFNWMEISAIGNELTDLTGEWDANTLVALPFDFQYYDMVVNQVYVSGNGWIYFGNSPDDWYSNQTIPGTGLPNGILGVFWDDLDMRTMGACYTYYDDVNNLFIIQWDGVEKSFDDGSLLTFQAILDPTGSITIQYLSMVGTLTSATVGLENSDGTDGVQVAFNTDYVEDNLAVKINTPWPDWLAVTPTSGTLNAGNTEDLTVTFDANGLTGGEQFTGNLAIFSNDPLNPDFRVPVTMNVTGGAPVIVADPTSLDFGDVFLGTSKSRTLNIMNDGDAVLEVTDISTAQAGYTVDQTAFNLSPGQDIDVTITLVPGEVGSFDATLTIANNDSDLDIPLTGSGTPFISTSVSEFNEVLAAGESVTKGLTITNEFGDNLPFSIYVIGAEVSVDPSYYPSSGSVGDVELMKWFNINNTPAKDNVDKVPSVGRDPESGSGGVRPSSSDFPITGLLNEVNIDAYSMDVWYDELVKYDLGLPDDVSLVNLGFTSYAGNFAYGNMENIFLVRDDDKMLVKYNIASDTYTDLFALTTENEDESFTDLETDYTTATLYGSTYSNGTGESYIYTIDRFHGNTTQVAAFPGYLFIAIAVDDLGRMYAHDILGDIIVRINTTTWEVTELGPTGINANYAQSMTFDQTTRQLIMAAYNVDNPYGSRNELRYVNRSTGATTLIGPFYGSGDGEMGFIASQGEGFLSVNLLTGTLPPGVSLDLQVTFDAANLLAGEYSSSIAIVGDELEGDPSVQVPAFLTVTGEPVLDVTQTSLPFENVFENGTSEPQYVSIYNNGTDMMHVTGLTVDNSDFSFTEYSLWDDTLAILEPGEPKVFEFLFSPTSVGLIEGTFTIETDGGNATVSLTGEGIPAPVMQMDVESFSHQAYPGQTQEHSMMMTNAGGNPLDYEISVGTMDTEANDVIAALEEGFEGGFLPDGWSHYDVGDVAPWQQTSARANSGSYSAYHNDDFADCDSWLVTPQISLGGNAMLEFYENINYSSYYVYSGVWISTGSPDPASGDYVELYEYDDSIEDTWSQRLLDLSAYADQDVYIAFVYQGYFAHEWYIDDVLVTYEEVPWLTLGSPAAGTLDPDASGEMILNVDASGLVGGVYQSGLIINSNDPVNPVYFVPFTLTVIEELMVTAMPDEDDENLYPNEEFIVPVNVTSLNDLGVASYQFTLNFDENLLEPLEIMTEGTLSDGLLLESNLGTAGQVSVAAAELPEEASMNGTPILFSIEGEGLLVNVKFKAKVALGDSSFTFSEVLFNEGAPAASSNGGDYSINVLYGDANLDVQVTAFDATTVLQDVVGIIDLNEVGELAANVSGDAGVTSFDASLILHYVAGLIDEFPVEALAAIADNSHPKTKLASEGSSEINPVSKNGKDKKSNSISTISKASLVLDKTSNVTAEDGSGNLLKIPVVLNEADKVYSIDLRLKYDDKIMDIDNLVTSLPEGWLVMHNVDGSYLNIAMAGIEPLTSGELGSIIVKLLDPTETVNMKGEAVINQSAPQTLDIDLKALPFEFSLSQNYPNPFNPSTTIKYQLPENTKVSLVVYNQIGQVVKTLVNQEQEAGYYKVRWSGTNDFGRQVASGVYLFRIQSGSYVDVKKMVFLK